jgi:RND family efflux transporter MFP subunit
VVGNTTKFTTLVTELKGYRPFQGELLYKIEIEGLEASTGTATLKSPGVFVHKEELPVGSGSIAYMLNNGELKDEVLVSEIVVFASIDEAEEAAHAEEHTGPNSVEFEKDQAWATEFGSVFAGIDTIYNVIRSGGEITGSLGDEKTVSATASGILVYKSDMVVGSSVSAGTALFTIIAGGIADHNLQAHFLKARSALEKATSKYERKLSLYNSEAISKADMEEAKLEYELAHTDFSSVSDGYDSGGKVVKTEATGFVKSLFKKEGDFVEVGDPLAVVAENKSLLLKAYVGQNEQANLRQIVSANFDLNGEIHSIREYNGRLVSYGKNVSLQEPRIPVYFELENMKELVVGSFVEVYIQTGPGKPEVVVPVSALLEDYGRYSVVVQTEGEKFQLRTVELGTSDGIYVQVVRGVEAGERIVLEGAYQVKMAKMSGKIPAHVH